MIKESKNLIYLLSCALKGEKADITKIDNMELESVYKIAKKHSLTAMSYQALENVAFKNKEKYEEILVKWRENKEKAVRREALFEIEKNEIVSFFNEKGIWYVLLKGAVIKNIYPKCWYREMGDIDILFDIDYRDELYFFMKKRNYIVKSFKENIHDIYIKEPVYNFEMHVSLCDRENNRLWEKYYREIKEKLIKDNNNKSGYSFSVDDFYIYITMHAYKHFDASGNGIRSLLDTYIYLKKYENDINWNYVEEEEKKLEIFEYEKKMRKLAKDIFEDNKLSDEENEIFKFIVTSGTYGKMERGMERTIDKKLKKIQDNDKDITICTKIKYIFKRIVPDIENYKNSNRFIYKTKIFIPFFYIYRVFRGVIKRRKYIVKEIKMLWKK